MMAKLLEMPKLSPTMEEGVLSAWHKKEGDSVAIDDLLAEVETDKATMEFRSFDKGTLLKILVPAGASVKLGQPVAVVGSPGEDISALVAQLPSAAIAAPPQEREPAKPPDGSPVPTAVETAAPPPSEPSQRSAPPGNVLERTSHAPEGVAIRKEPSEGRVFASPYVRKIAREVGIDLQGAQGTGPGGRVVAADLESMRARAGTSLTRGQAAGAASLSVLSGEESEVRPLSQMRKAIARRLTESKTTVPHFYLSMDIDAAALGKLRDEINAELRSDAAAKENGGAAPLKVSFNDLVIKACAVALVNVPECNASYSPDAIILHKRVDISVAVAVPDGLVTPVLRRADQKSLLAIARETRDLAARARGRKLKPEEMQNGTFSVSNLGMFGVDGFAAVINPPEGAILAVGQIRDVPVVENGGIVPGKRMSVTLSCDHRVVDGAVGAAFLAELRRLLERPLRVLTG
jgi:pyruvate dehydrogenase E2 component (dihydrolipoamide acetyltransferase)